MLMVILILIGLLVWWLGLIHAAAVLFVGWVVIRILLSNAEG